MTETLGLPPRSAKKLGLTALIDVVFILLMFFMLTSSFVQWRSFDLASTGTAAPTTTNSSTPALLIVHEDGSLTGVLSMEQHHWPSLDSALLDGPQGLQAGFALHQQTPENSSTLTLLPEPQVNVQRLVTLMARLKESGIRNLNLGDALDEVLPQ